MKLTEQPSAGLIVTPLFRKINDKQFQEINEELSQKIFVLEKEKLDILCGICRCSVTTADDMIDVNGSHFHTFRNPAGIVFRIRCFSSASGCSVIGQPTEEFTWFPGYSWNFALCSHCFAHLGWQFQSKAHRFFGLIRDNIVESSSIH
jgi:hypothetical protein